MSENQEKIEELRDRLKRKGALRASCANLGRGITDSILREMREIEREISRLREE